MAESRWRWTREEWSALLFLGQLAADRAGYQLGGVRGWAHLNDVTAAIVGGLFEVLPRLHARGLLERADVRAPGRIRPEWVYRITPRGVQVAEAQGRKPHRAIAVPRREKAERGVYAPTRQRGALELLRTVHDDPAVPVRFGGRGWLTGRGLGARVEAANRRRRRCSPLYAVDGTDLRWLVDKGLVERRIPHARISSGGASPSWGEPCSCWIGSLCRTSVDVPRAASATIRGLRPEAAERR
jgi:hypothetical protein